MKFLNNIFNNNYNNLKILLQNIKFYVSHVGKHKNWHNKHSELKIIKHVAKGQELVVTKSDKEYGLIILDKFKYYTK